MEAEVFVVSELGCEGVGEGADTHLEAVSVFYEGSAVLADLHLSRGRLREGGGYQRLVVFYQIIEFVKAYEVSVGKGNVGVDNADYQLGVLDGSEGAVYRCTQRYAAFCIWPGNVYQCRSELDGAGAVQTGRFS
jgi:hypothetical protein